ncbi:uncharacterized protein LOC134238049, partial [Saccostrea cucullata]|uniref:uncharacterized protein LOC134238049 n=1 Tax=Saccostrea cuccullata TaxID=36930 RepID=UPI002ED26BE2
MEKLEELQTTVHLQSDRISQLEVQNRNLEKLIAIDLHSNENKQDERISTLEKQYLRLDEILLKHPKDVLAEKILKRTTKKKISMFLSRQYVQEKLYRGLKTRVQNVIHFLREKSSFPNAVIKHKDSLIRKGSTYLNSGNTIDGSVTGTVVVHVVQGDDVLLRTGGTYNGGNII